ncbi:GAF domain-containing protein [Clavibacter michiganensis]|uniref:GAF domain-containing protein n=1 Tax=Clavibacter michiganensis TaxID=28447 RepID=A0A251YJF6_9MICO|nr:GAF domain-containing protein [Clavibacter michiganensis]OUE24382.1 hypothetical protein BFL37_10750 [Clavibacter michiganensis]
MTVVAGHDPVLADVADRIHEAVGWRLFTVLRWDPERRALRRIATSHPDLYPLDAEKSLEVSGSWLDVVIEEKRAFLGATDAEVAAVFADMDLIRSLGCGAVINTPVIEGGRVVGTLAVLDAEGRYDSSSVATVEAVVADCGSALTAAFTRPEASTEGSL